MNFEQFLEKYQKVPVEEYPNQVPEKPLVSVCVQTYQHAPFIRECLDSILMQKTDFPFEILVGEDASTDGTREICIDYAEKFPDKIRLFLHWRENNIEILGTPTGRYNSLYNLYLSKGDFISICEGDDYWTDPYKLQKQYDFMVTNPDYAICGHDAFIVEQGKIIKESKLPESQKKDFRDIQVQRGVFILTLSVFFRRRLSYPPECMNVINFDTFLFLFLGQFGHYKYMANIKPAAYRQHPGGIWSSKKRDWQELSELNTFFWISKYFQRINQPSFQDHHGLKVVKKSISYLVKPSWANIWIMIKHLFKLKYPITTLWLFRIKDKLVENQNN